MNDIPFVLCVRADVPTPFTDNVKGICARCHSAVVHRPHIPTPSTLICMQCFPAVRDEYPDAFKDGPTITTATILELMALSNRN